MAERKSNFDGRTDKKINLNKQTYQKKDGTKATKEFTSTTKSASQLGIEAKAWCKQRGYKPTCGSAGTRH